MVSALALFNTTVCIVIGGDGFGNMIPVLVQGRGWQCNMNGRDLIVMCFDNIVAVYPLTNDIGHVTIRGFLPGLIMLPKQEDFKLK